MNKHIISLLILSVSPYAAHAADAAPDPTDLDQGDLKMGILGLEAVVRSSSEDGTSGGASGHVGAILTQAADGHNKYPLVFAQIDGNYNQVSGGGRGFSTGADLRTRLAVGVTPDGDLSNSCDVYFAMEAKADASVWYHHSESGRASVGPETGLACQTGRTLFMFSPSVQAGLLYGNGEGVPFSDSFSNPVDVSAPLLYALNFRLSTGESDADAAQGPAWSKRHRGFLTAEFQAAPVTDGVSPGERDVSIYDTQISGAYEFAPKWMANVRSGVTVFDPKGKADSTVADSQSDHAVALSVGVEKAF